MSHSSPSSIYYNNKTVTSPFEIANTFNNYFSNIALDIQSSIKYSAKELHEFLPPLSIKPFFLSLTDENEIISIISALDSQKAPGPSSIPINILKSMKNDISDQLAVLFNLSFTSGSFPTIFRTSKVTPIYKKDPKLKCSNYIPISLLSNIDKILERIVYNRLYKYFENNKPVWVSTKTLNHSCSNPSDRTNPRTTYSEKYGCERFVDFQKAFDTVDHTILIQMLNYYCVRDKANNWFPCYLKNRTEFVTINGFNSELKENNYGVPQGSILGPLLFLIYINDVHYSIKFCKVHHFADDTNLKNFNSSIKAINKQVNKDLKTLSSWLNASKICLNVSQTEFVLFRSAKIQQGFGLKLKLNRKRLYPTNSVK